MTAKTLAILIIRGIALWILLPALVQLILTAFGIVLMYLQNNAGYTQFFYTLYSLARLSEVIIGVLLWFAAGLIAHFMVPGSAADESLDADQIHRNALALGTFIFAGIGVALVAIGVTEVAQVVWRDSMQVNQHQDSLSTIMGGYTVITQHTLAVAIKPVLGLALIYFARPLASRIASQISNADQSIP